MPSYLPVPVSVVPVLDVVLDGTVALMIEWRKKRSGAGGEGMKDKENMTVLEAAKQNGKKTAEPPMTDKKNHVVKQEKVKKKTSKIADEHFLEALQKLGHPAVSSEVAKLLHTTNGAVRTRMAKLIKDGKVVGDKPDKDKHVKLLYRVA